MGLHSRYTVKRIFIASPGDLSDERKIFPEILQRINERVAHSIGVHLEPLGWEDTLPGIGRPQAKINEDVKKCDLFVMLLWKKLGTPTGKYSSGTVEEYELAKELNRESGKPEDIWMYFRKVPDPMLADPGPDLTQVLDFRKNLEQERSLIYHPYDSENDWKEKLDSHLCKWLMSKDEECPDGKGLTEHSMTDEATAEIARLRKALEKEKSASESAQSRLRLQSLKLSQLAKTAEEDGRFTDAEMLYAQAVEGYPEPNVLVMYGVFLAERGDWEGAEKKLRLALKLDEKSGLAWNNLGCVLMELERHGEAEAAFGKALQLDNGDGTTWYNLGVSLANQKKFRSAEAAYRSSLKVNPTFAKAWSNLAQSLILQGKLDEAVEAGRNAVEHDPSSAICWRIFRAALSKLGRHQEALEASKKVLETMDNAEVRNTLAYELVMTGLLPEAENEVKRALELDPKYSFAHATLGLVLFAKDDLDGGRQGYERAMEILPDDLDLKQKYHFEYGRALGRNGHKEEAQRELKAALSIDADYTPKDRIQAELDRVK